MPLSSFLSNMTKVKRQSQIRKMTLKKGNYQYEMSQGWPGEAWQPGWFRLCWMIIYWASEYILCLNGCVITERTLYIGDTLSLQLSNIILIPMTQITSAHHTCTMFGKKHRFLWISLNKSRSSFNLQRISNFGNELLRIGFHVKLVHLGPALLNPSMNLGLSL